MPKTNFIPALHGYHFANSFRSYDILLPFLPVPLPFGGLCGGMAMSALRYYLHRLPIPTHTTCDFDGTVVWPLTSTGSRLRQYLVDCQRDSYGPLGDASVVNWCTILGVTFETQFDWTVNEFTNIKNYIDHTNQPVVIGLRRRTDSPIGHQMLAIGYDENPKRVYVYDPNHPDEECVLRIDEVARRLIGPDTGSNRANSHFWSSFFVTNGIMRPDRPPYIDLGMQEGITLRTTSTSPRVGERLEMEFVVRNFGDFPADLRQLYVYVRDPMNGNRDELLGGGDNDGTPISPGGERRIRRVAERFGDIPGTYTIGVSYLSCQDNWIAVPAIAGGTRQSVLLNLLPATPVQAVGTWTSLGGILTSPPAVGKNQDGRLEVFARGTDDKIWHFSQAAANAPSSWSNWECLTGDQTFRGPVSVVTNNWNKLEIFARGRDNSIWHRWQNDPNVREASRWSSWSSLGSAAGGMQTDPTAALNWDKRIEVFAVGGDNQVYHNFQRYFDAFGSPWSGWLSLPGRSFKGLVTAETDADGRLHVVARALDDTVWVNYQLTRSGDWSGWQNFSGITSGDPTLARNNDGRLELFLRGSDGRVWHRWQTSPNGIWSIWQLLNESSVPPAFLIGEGRVTVLKNNAGVLELFARIGTGEIVNIHQITAAPFWNNYTSVGANFTSDPALGIEPNGMIDVFALGPNREVLHSSISR